MKKTIILNILFAIISIRLGLSQDLVTLTTEKSCLNSCTGVIEMILDENQLDTDWQYPFHLEYTNLETGDGEFVEITDAHNSLHELCHGNYEFVLHFDELCEYPFSSTIEELDLSIINLSIESSNLNFDGTCDASIIVNTPSDQITYTLNVYEAGSVSPVLSHQLISPSHTVEFSGFGQYTAEITTPNDCAVEFDFELKCCDYDYATNGYTPLRIPDPQITLPSSCSSVDGVIYFKFGLAQGGQEPYTYEWNTGDTSPDLYDIPSGIYILTVTDANGCSIEQTYELISDDYPNFTLESVNAECAYAGKSAVYYVLENTWALNEYTVEWSNGSSEPFYIDNLFWGTYGITITHTASGCSASDEITIVDPNTPPVEIINIVTNKSCPESPTGTVEFEIIGGTPPYQVITGFQDVIIDDQLFLDGLPNGTYSVILIDDCGSLYIFNSLYQIKEHHLEADFSSTFNCPIEGSGTEITVFVTGDNPPYSYEWSNGATTDIISGITSTSNLTVTITDNAGCTIVKSTRPEVVGFEITRKENPCHSINNGKIFIDIFNPDSKNIIIRLNGIVVYNGVPYDYEIHVLDNLYGDQEYTLSVSIGDNCILEDVFFLNSEEDNFIFSHYDDEERLCVYDEICGPTYLEENYFESPQYDIANATGGEGIFRKCGIPVKCQDEYEHWQGYSKKNIKVCAYKYLLHKAFVSGYLHEEDYRQMLDDMDGYKGCAIVRYCTANFIYIWVNNIVLGTKSCHLNEDGCIEADCIGWFNDATYCDDDIFPDYALSDVVEFHDCIPERINLALLIKFQDQLDDRFKSLFVDSDLNALINKFKDGHDSRYRCSSVTFCKNDFSVLHHDIESVRDCPMIDEDCLDNPCHGIFCDEGLICINGTCVEVDETDPCEYVVCPPGQTCSSGTCVDETLNGCDNVVCNDGEYCVNGVCISEDENPCEGVICPIYYECDEESASCVQIESGIEYSGGFSCYDLKPFEEYYDVEVNSSGPCMFESGGDEFIICPKFTGAPIDAINIIPLDVEFDDIFHFGSGSGSTQYLMNCSQPEESLSLTKNYHGELITTVKSVIHGDTRTQYFSTFSLNDKKPLENVHYEFLDSDVNFHFREVTIKDSLSKGIAIESENNTNYYDLKGGVSEIKEVLRIGNHFIATCNQIGPLAIDNVQIGATKDLYNVVFVFDLEGNMISHHILNGFDWNSITINSYADKTSNQTFAIYARAKTSNISVNNIAYRNVTSGELVKINLTYDARSTTNSGGLSGSTSIVQDAIISSAVKIASSFNIQQLVSNRYTGGIDVLIKGKGHITQGSNVISNTKNMTYQVLQLNSSFQIENNFEINDPKSTKSIKSVKIGSTMNGDLIMTISYDGAVDILGESYFTSKIGYATSSMFVKSRNSQSFCHVPFEAESELLITDIVVDSETIFFAGILNISKGEETTIGQMKFKSFRKSKCWSPFISWNYLTEIDYCENIEPTKHRPLDKTKFLDLRASESQRFLLIYPNPFQDGFIIESSNKGELKSIKVYDVYGKEVWKNHFVGNTETSSTINYVNLEDRPSGVYLILAEKKDGSKETHRIVKAQ